jgi:hypothetical protein
MYAPQLPLLSTQHYDLLLCSPWNLPRRGQWARTQVVPRHPPRKHQTRRDAWRKKKIGTGQYDDRCANPQFHSGRTLAAPLIYSQPPPRQRCQASPPHWAKAFLHHHNFTSRRAKNVLFIPCVFTWSNTLVHSARVFSSFAYTSFLMHVDHDGVFRIMVISYNCYCYLLMRDISVRIRVREQTTVGRNVVMMAALRKRRVLITTK